MLTVVTVYLNTDAPCATYQDGHRLHAVTSARLPTGVEPDPDTAADWVLHTCHGDLDRLEGSRDNVHGEITFLTACVYRLLGHRPLSAGDVVHIRDRDRGQWLAREPSGWRRITTPSNVDRAPFGAATVDERLRSQPAGRDGEPRRFTTEQVNDALNQAANDILDAVHAGDEGLRDALNLMVNATGSYLAGTADTLAEAVDCNYSQDYPTVLSWIESAL